MSQNPFSAGGVDTPFHDAPMHAPRTSALAVASLVLGILSIITCCVGIVPGALAGVFGAVAIISINSKPTMLQGRGVATGGLITGTIGIFLCVVLWFGASNMYREFANQLQQPFIDIEKSDIRTLQQVLSPDAAKRLDEPRVQAFRAAYRARLGEFRRIDASPLAGLKAFTSGLQHPQAETLIPGLVPFAVRAEFAKGDAMIWFMVPQNVSFNSNSKTASIFGEVVIFPDSGEPIRLLGDPPPSAPSTQPPPTPPANPPPDAPAATPAPGSN